MASLTNRIFLDGGLGKSIANRGKGKTMAIVFLILIELSKDPTLRVCSNVKINAPRCHYLPYLFADFKKMKNYIFLIDDVSNIRNLDRYSATVSNITRKLETDMIFTGQYVKQMPPTIREQINYSIYPYYSKHNDTLKIFIQYDTGRKVRFEIKNAVKFIKKTNLYDTREKPPTILERDAIREIATLSKSVKDIQKYLELYTGDKKEKARLLKEIKKNKHYKGSKNGEIEENKHDQKWYDMYILNKSFNVPLDKLSVKYKTHRSVISHKLNQIKYEVQESNYNIINS